MPTTSYQTTEKSGRVLTESFRSPSRHLFFFLKQMSSFLLGGHPLDRALQLLSQTLPAGKMNLAVGDLRERVRRGQSLSQAMQAHPALFSSFVAAVVRTGERAGNLGKVLRQLAEQIERELELRAQIRNALAYPLFVAFFSFGVVIFLFTYVIPTLATVVEEQGGTLPALTRILFAISAGVRRWGIVLGLGLACGLFFLRQKARHPSWKVWWDAKVLRLPVMGSLVKMREAGRFCSTMATLLGSGMEMVPALETVEAVLQNEEFRKWSRRAREQVVRGEPLSASLQKSPLFPRIVPSFVRAGEESGDLKNQIAGVGKMLEEETQARLKQMATFLEPALIIIVGVLVGLCVLAVVLPIVQLNQLIQ